jgi:hypothetical protein
MAEEAYDYSGYEYGEYGEGGGEVDYYEGYEYGENGTEYYEYQDGQTVQNFISDEPEERDLFICEWNPLPRPLVESEAHTSASVWHEIDGIVRLRRLDVYQSLFPQAQQASADPKESLKMRNTEGWAAIRSIFFMDRPVRSTKEVLIETGSGPIRRQRVSPTYLVLSSPIHR